MVGQTFTIDEMTADDWPAVRRIYVAGIETGLATFETEAPRDWETWQAGKRPDCRLVARTTEGRVAGWAGLSPTSKRPVYAGVAEVSVYVDPEFWGLGVGHQLLAALIEAAETAGVWTLTASIFPENTTSLRLHEKQGFKMLGRRERIAQLHGVWRDTIWLERRSEVVAS